MSSQPDGRDSDGIATAVSPVDFLRMAADDNDDFRIRVGRSRSRGARVNRRARSFVGQVNIAVRKAGGDPNRIGGAAGKGSGRFNARGRGAKVAGGLPRERDGWSRDASGARFRSRRVVVKARVVKLNPQTGSRGPKMRGVASKAVDAHLRYLERDGVTKDGEKGRVYSAGEDEAAGRAFIARGRQDRHQFRFIVAPEDSTEMTNLQGFTRDLMRQLENDLGTQLDWVAVDHYNTGHPHTHVMVRGITDDRKILNIAGDYIAYGIRHRASELVTLELGPQTELDVARKLANEVDAERLTRLDRMLIAEQGKQGLVDLRPNASDSYPIRANRHLLIDRAKRLGRYGLAQAIEPGRWALTAKAEDTLRELGERNDIIKTMHRALEDHGAASERGPGQYAMHAGTVNEPIIGRVIGKGLAGDEMGDRLHLVIDGVDGRAHYVETTDHSKFDEIWRGHIVALEPTQLTERPRPADINIRDMTDEAGIYRPSAHLEAARAKVERIGGDAEAYVRSHVRRLEALRRVGHVERIDADNWKIPADIADRGMAHNPRNRGSDFSVRILSALDLDQQVASDGATWLDRELVSPNRTGLANNGFGREVTEAMERRKQSLVNLGQAVRLDSGGMRVSKNIIANLERAELTRVGATMAAERGPRFATAKTGEYVTGTLVGSTQLASGRFAMVDDGISFQLVPWQPVLENRIGQHITGIVRNAGGIEWSFGRKRGLGL
jgi:type IV secretory pathway VirD2 relaxase